MPMLLHSGKFGISASNCQNLLVWRFAYLHRCIRHIQRRRPASAQRTVDPGVLGSSQIRRISGNHSVVVRASRKCFQAIPSPGESRNDCSATRFRSLPLVLAVGIIFTTSASDGAATS